MNKAAIILATFFGAGFSPKAPGTMGAIFAFVMSYFFGSLHLENFTYLTFYSILILLTYFIGVWATDEVSKEWGSDPSKVVIDEALGYWITIFLFPCKLSVLLIGLVLFRIFDIWKPLGIRKIDQMHSSSHAVMLDDALAGVYAAVVLFVIIKIFPL